MTPRDRGTPRHVPPRRRGADQQRHALEPDNSYPAFKDAALAAPTNAAATGMSMATERVESQTVVAGGPVSSTNSGHCALTILYNTVIS